MLRHISKRIKSFIYQRYGNDLTTSIMHNVLDDIL